MFVCIHECIVLTAHCTCVHEYQYAPITDCPCTCADQEPPRKDSENFDLKVLISSNTYKGYYLIVLIIVTVLRKVMYKLN